MRRECSYQRVRRRGCGYGRGRGVVCDFAASELDMSRCWHMEVCGSYVEACPWGVAQVLGVGLRLCGGVVVVR